MSYENMLAANAGMAPPAAESGWHRLRQRVLSAAVIAPPAVAAAYVGAPYFDVLVALATGFLVWEVGRTSGIDSPIGDRFVVATVALVGGGAALGLWLWAVAGLMVMASIGTAQGVARGRSGQGWGWGALFYIGSAALAALWLRAEPAMGRDIVLWVIAVAVATDCGAYAVGRLIGGPRLAPGISPGKTWAGACGGLIFGAAAGAVMPLAGALGGVTNAVLASLGVSMVAQLGDLIESAFKRRFGVKDMGDLIPGHGGLADRLDSVMAAMLVVALGRLLFEQGVAAW